MIKIIFCLRRLPRLTREEFHSYWHNQHAPLVRSVASTLGLRRYVQSHTFTHSGLQLTIDARGGEVAPYDGIAELWYDSVEMVMALVSGEEVRRAGRALLEDERKFIDLPNSPLFYSVEHEIVAEPNLVE